MKKFIPISLVLMLFTACSAQNITPIADDMSGSVQAQSATSTKTFTFDHKKVTNAKDPKAVNPAPQKLVIKVKKYAKKNSTNPNQDNVYFQLTNAIENLANMPISADMTDGTTSYDGAANVFSFVKNANQSILNIASIDPSLQTVQDAINSLNAANFKEGQNTYADIKIFHALIYQALADSYDGEKFNATAQDVVKAFSQMPQFAEQFDDAAKYMRQAIIYYAAKYPSLSSYNSQTNPYNGESWADYTRRLKQMLVQISKMGK